MKVTPLKLSALTLICLLGLSACDKQGSAEKAGEKLDTAIENAETKMDLASEKMEDAAVKAGEKVEDVAITTQVKAALLAESSIKSLDINVDTMNGVVNLTGSTGTPESSQKASEIAGAIEGVTKVNNELVIK